MSEVSELLKLSVETEVSSRGILPVMDNINTYQINEAARFLTEGKHCGLMIAGIPGNGKTTLMRAIQGLINVMGLKYWTGEDFIVREILAKEIVRMAKDNGSAFYSLCRYPALAIDDFGEEPMEVVSYGNISNPLIDLLSIRYSEQLLTILTTNTPNDMIRTLYGARISDRLNEMMQVIIFRNDSYRGKLKHKTEVNL